MKRYFIFISVLLCMNFAKGQGKIYPAFGFEYNRAHNSYGDIFKIKKPELITDIRNGSGINIGIAYIKKFTIYPYFKTGFLYHGGMKRDSIFQNTNAYYKSHYLLFPSYIGIQYWGSVGFTIEVGADYVIGYHLFTGFDRYRTNDYVFGWNARITFGIKMVNNTIISLGVGQKFRTKFFHTGLFIPILFNRTDTE